MAAPSAQLLEDLDARCEMAAAEIKAVQRRARVAGQQIARMHRDVLEALEGTEEHDRADTAESR